MKDSLTFHSNSLIIHSLDPKPGITVYMCLFAPVYETVNVSDL